MAEIARPADESNVIPLGARVQISPQEAPFTGEERALLRAMMADYRAMEVRFNAITQGCPMAKRLLPE